MEKELFEKLMQSANEMLAHARGELELKTTVLPVPHKPKELDKSEIVAIRKQLNASQSLFAKYLNVSIKTVQCWEQGLRKPSQAALKLLSIAKVKPEVLFIG